MKKLCNVILNIIAIMYMFTKKDTEVSQYEIDDNNLVIDKRFYKNLLYAYKEDIIYTLLEYVNIDI